MTDEIRIAVFGSFHRGFHVLSELLKGPLASRVRVVGVATDDVHSGHISRDRRVWAYPHAPEEETMVEELAAGNLMAAQHPYTRGLLNCLPRIGGERGPLPGLDRTGAWAQ